MGVAALPREELGGLPSSQTARVVHRVLLECQTMKGDVTGDASILCERIHLRHWLLLPCWMVGGHGLP